MDKIEVKILKHNLDGTSGFLARLTQRGNTINSMADLEKLYDERVDTTPSKELLSLPHTTIQRMNYITVAITGLSTKAVTQFRTHAKRLTFISTSTQYSAYDGRENNFVIPNGINEKIAEYAYATIQSIYEEMLEMGIDKDYASYFLPQGLRKALVISGNLDDWSYVLKTRLCHRNTEEVQYISRLIYKEIEKVCGSNYTINMLPSCVIDKCHEGKFSCGERFEI